MDRLRYCLSLAVLLAALTGSTADAEDGNSISKPYDRLNLSESQIQGIHALDSDWNSHYLQTKPKINGLQHHLAELLDAPHADPIEITSTQERINQLREQLGVYATSTYLRKRRLLTAPQKEQLDHWMRRMFASRKQTQF